MRTNNRLQRTVRCAAPPLNRSDGLHHRTGSPAGRIAGSSFRSRRLAVVVMIGTFSVGMAGCMKGCAAVPNPDQLDSLGFTEMTIKNQPFRLWVADEDAERINGLMFVTEDRLAPFADGAERGMIFVFEFQSMLSFWMRNVPINLDIAYLDAQGVVTATHTMAAFDTDLNKYTSVRPAMYAIEARSGTWSRLGLKAGDTLQIPASVLKRKP